MNAIRKRPVRYAGLGLLGVVIAIGFCWVLPGATIRLSPQSPLSELKAAQSIWSQQRLSDYRMTVSFASFSFIGTFHFTVQDNHVTRIESANSVPVAVPISPAARPGWYTNFETFLPPTLEQYTVDQLFDFAAQKIRNEPVPPVIAWCGATNGDPMRLRYEITVDREKGYITSLVYTNCVKYEWGVGLVCPVIADCSAGFHIRDLQPLP